LSNDAEIRYVREDATFRVVETFKGRFVAGSMIHIVSDIGPGPCGQSAKNDPVGLEVVGKDGKTHAPTFSGRWLIYGYGPEPWSLNLTSRSSPMEFGGEDDVRELRRLIKARASRK
jgi:hypothetical protein